MMFRSIRSATLLASLIVSGHPSSAARSAPSVLPRQLEASGAVSVTPYALNDAGTVAGSITTVEGGLQATFWRGNMPITLERLGPYGGVCYAINGAGAVAGTVYTPSGEFRAAVWSSAGYLELMRGPSVAMGISDAGDVVGWAVTPEGDTRAYHWRRGITRWISGPASAALAVNDRGQTVGYTRQSNGIRAFLWEERAGGTAMGRAAPPGQGIRDLGTLGGPVSQALSINNRGQVVGWSQTARGNVDAFLYEDSRMRVLPGLGGSFSRANFINDQGIAVGVATRPDNLHRAVMWADGRVVDLNSLLPPNSGWALWGAVSINESLKVIGYGAKEGWPCSFVLQMR